MTTLNRCDCCRQIIFKGENITKIARSWNGEYENVLEAIYCDKCTKRILKKIENLSREQRGLNYSSWTYENGSP